MKKEKAFDYPGERANVSWHGRLCIHIGECGHAKGELFIGGRKPWCQPDLVSDDEVQEVIVRCPTGALSVKFADGSREEQAEAKNSVHVAYNGPLFVRGDLEIAGAPEKVPGLKFRAALCRCGKSKIKPFCDNSHIAGGFVDYGAVGETGDADALSGGPLQIKPLQDGPLLLDGNVRIMGGAGRQSWQGSKVALCRCGGSKNKPFCDGQHKQIGFKSD
jgi:CDGSH-type Zn-finger protein/uncharacterized Fe-S cluster protein YjdI